MRLTGGNASLRCAYCKTVAVVAPDDGGTQFLDAAAGLSCSACGEPLWNAVLAHVAIQACRKCHGILAPMGTFEDLIGNMRAQHPGSEDSPPANPADLKRKVTCPKCRLAMDTHFYFGGGHAVISTCERCELHWLDGGVLMRIVRAPQHESAIGTYSSDADM
jgi:Zn-finger nucleic acid-binding protein